MRIAMTLLALALATSAGCKKKEKAADTAGSGSAMVASGAEEMGSGAAAEMGSA